MFKLLPITKLTLKKLSKFINILPKLGKFALSGHTGLSSIIKRQNGAICPLREKNLVVD